MRVNRIELIGALSAGRRGFQEGATQMGVSESDIGGRALVATGQMAPREPARTLCGSPRTPAVAERPQTRHWFSRHSLRAGFADGTSVHFGT